MNYFKAAVMVEVHGPDQKQVDAAMRRVSRATNPQVNALLRLVKVKKNNLCFTTRELGARHNSAPFFKQTI